MKLAELRGRAAVVTGGASGIGRAIVRSLARAGMSVAIADRDASSAKQLAQELAASSHRIIAVGCDVSVYEEVAALAATANEQLGSVAVLCNNAGIGGGVGASVVDRPASEWEAALGVNLNGVIHGIRAFVPAMIASGEPAHIVNTASLAAFFPAAGTGPYTTSKFAVAGLSEVLRAELSEHQIGVSVLCPGPFDTAIWGEDDASPRGNDPAVLGPRVLAGIEADEAFIFTHPEFAPMLSQRFDRIADALRGAGVAMRDAESQLS